MGILLVIIICLCVLTDLKNAVTKRTEIPITGQRLIFSGKHLNPESKLLSDFNISSGASIHLFPRLVQAPSTSSATTEADEAVGTSGQTTRILRVSRMQTPTQGAGIFSDYNTLGANAAGGPRSLHTTVPEVRLWCYILFFSSFMTLFNHLSFIINTGKASTHRAI